VTRRRPPHPPRAGCDDVGALVEEVARALFDGARRGAARPKRAPPVRAADQPRFWRRCIATSRRAGRSAARRAARRRRARAVAPFAYAVGRAASAT
jgi:hypothetical protein